MGAAASTATKERPLGTRPNLGNSIQFKLAIFVALLVIVALGTLSVVGYISARRTLRLQIRERLSVIADDRAKMLSGYIREQMSLLAQMINRRQVRIELAEYVKENISAEEAHRQIKDRLADALIGAPEIRAVWITDRAGRVITASDDQYLGRVFTTDPDFQQGLLAKHFGLPRMVEDTAQVLLAGPVAPLDGMELGVVMVLLEPDTMVRFLTDTTGLGDSGEVLVEKRDGAEIHYVLAPPRHREVTKTLLTDFPQSERVMNHEAEFIATRDYRGVQVLAAFQNVGFQDWRLVAKMDEAEAYEPIRKLRQLLLVLLATVLLAVLAGSFLLARQFAKPILELSDAASSLGRGDFGVRVPVQSSDEIGILAAGFNRMAEELAASYANLERRVADRTRELQISRDQIQAHSEELSRSEEALLKQTTILQSILANMGDGVVVADEQGKFLIFNPAAERILGIGATEASPDQWSRQYGLYLADTVTPVPTEQLPLVRAIRNEVVEDAEIFVRHPALPEGIWINACARPLRDDQGILRGGIAVFRDVTERKHAEEQLLKLSRAVEQSASLVVIADTKGAIEYVNPKFTQVTGYTLAEVLGKNPRIWKSGKTPPAEYQRMWQTITAGGEWRGEFHNRKKNGELYWTAASISPIRHPQGEITHFVSTQEDITELKQAEQALRESEERLQAILDNSTAVIYAKGLDRRYLLVNKQYETLFHISRAQIKGKTDADLFPHEMADVLWTNDRKVIDAKHSMEFEEIVPQDDGLHTYISIKFPLLDAAGEPYAACGISTDITERKRAEEELMHERHLLRSLMNNAPDAIYFKDTQSRFTRINQALALKNGLSSPAEAIGKTDFDFFAPEHAQPAFEDEQEVMRTGQPIVAKEEREVWPDGRESWVMTTKLPLRDKDGNIIGTFGISRDITKNKQAEQALRDSEALYHSLVETLPLNVFRKDREGRFTFANRLFLQTLGHSIDQIIGKTDFDFYPSELAEKYRRDDQQVMEHGGVLEKVEEHQAPSGERIFVQVIKCPMQDSTAAVVGTQVMFWDVTARRKAEEALQNSEHRYRQFTEASQDAIVVANQQGYLTLFNAAAQKTFGYAEAEVLGKPITLLMPKEFYEAHEEGFHRYLDTRVPRVVGRTVELRGRRKNGEVFHLDLTLTPLDLPEGISFLAAIRDTTERHRNAEEQQRMQTRVAQSERLASLGLLSAGVAHEINNPLAFVANNLAVLDRDIRGVKELLDVYAESHAVLETAIPDLAKRIAHITEEIDLPYVKQHIGRILESTREGVKRVADIVQKLRGFARLDQTAVDRVNIHDAIASSIDMIQGRLSRRNICIAQQFGDVPLIACAPGQINQVFLNLLVNAMQAIEATRKPSGRIEIRTRSAGNKVIVEVTDNGCGIPPEVLPKIFDPFFTTKTIGEGTGLGLNITHGIVKDHKGEIEVESTLGQGSCFRVILPLAQKPQDTP